MTPIKPPPEASINTISALRRKQSKKLVSELTNLVESISAIIKALPARKFPLAPDHNSISVHGSQIYIPYPQNVASSQSSGYFSFEKPTRVDICSDLAEANLSPINGFVPVDIAVTVPTKLSQLEPKQSASILTFRALYVAALAAGIFDASQHLVEVQFSAFNDDLNLPILYLTSFPSQAATSSKTNLRFVLRVLLAFEVATLRQAFGIRSQSVTHGSTSDVTKVISTPGSQFSTWTYTSFQGESLRPLYQDLTAKKARESSEFTDLLLLGRLWLAKIGYDSSAIDGGLGAFEWTCISCKFFEHLRTSKDVCYFDNLGSLKLFKTLLTCLSSAGNRKSFDALGLHGTPISHPSGPVLHDIYHSHNILFKMAWWSYERLQKECQEILLSLNRSPTDTLNSLFASGITTAPMMVFDYAASFIGPNCSSDARRSMEESSILPFQTLHRLIREGLGDRIRLMWFTSANKSIWSLTHIVPRETHLRTSTLFFELNDKTVNRLVDKDPLEKSSQPEHSFRELWGEAAELRRFKNGEIQDAVTWTNDSVPSIVSQILSLLFDRHVFPPGETQWDFVSDHYIEALPINKNNKITESVSAYNGYLSLFRQVQQNLMSAQDLPLSIRRVMSTDSRLRYASQLVPSSEPSSNSHGDYPAVNLLLQAESSSQWPSTKEGIIRVKLALLLQISRWYTKQDSATKTALGVDRAPVCHAKIPFLDVQLPSHPTFRLQIVHDDLLTHASSSMGSIASSSLTTTTSQTSSELEANHQHVLALSHSQIFATLCTRHPFLSPSVRLMKKWRDNQMLSEHISDELIELLVARNFVNSQSVPASTMSGFLRTLQYISRWDWRSEPLIVGMSAELSPEAVIRARSLLSMWRKSDPLMNRVVIFAVSTEWTDGIIHKTQGGSPIVAARFVGLAQAAIKSISHAQEHLGPTTLMKPSYAEYDFLIRLQLPQRPIYTCLGAHSLYFDARAAFIAEVAELFKHSITFFHNATSLLVLGGLWTSNFRPNTWKVKHQFSTLPMLEKADGNAISFPNRGAIIHDIARIGGDLIKSIKICNKDALSG